MPPSADTASQPPDRDATLLSIRQARDHALARETEIAQRLRHAQEQLAEVQDSLAEAREAAEEARRREVTTRRERDELQMKLLEMNGQKLAYLESEWRVTSALSETRQELAAVTAERDELRQRLGSPDLATFRDDPRIQELGREVERLRMMVYERDQMIETQQRRFTEEHELLEAQLVALRVANLPEELEDAIDPNVASESSEEDMDISEVIAEADELLATLQGTEADLPVLEAVREILTKIERDAAEAGITSLHRLTRASLEMVLWLRNSPSKVPANLHDLRTAVALIGDLANRETPPRLGTGTVYAVDDDIDNCECIAMALQKYQLTATYAANSAKALAHLQETPHDLVLLDFDMPGMNGIELFHAMRSSPANSQTPVLFVSGLESAKSLVADLNDPTVDFVSKPYNLTTLSLRGMVMMLRAGAQEG